MFKPESSESGRRAVPVRSDSVATNAPAASVTLSSAAPRIGVAKLNRRSLLVTTALGTTAAMIAGRGSGGVLRVTIATPNHWREGRRPFVVPL